jgi:hypothetical protein
MQKGGDVYQLGTSTWIQMGDNKRPLNSRTLDSLKTMGLVKKLYSGKNGAKFGLTKMGVGVIPIH